MSKFGRQIRLLLSNFKQFIVIRYIGYRRNVNFGTSVRSYNSRYEGNNMIAEGCLLRDCLMGRGTYVSRNCSLERVEIGRYCSIGSDVAIGLGHHPTSTWVSIYPAFYMDMIPFTRLTFHRGKEKFPPYKNINDSGTFHCKVGNDVWIGRGVTIVSGVTIGDGAVIGAGAVVIKDVAPYEIVGGIPARHIRYRFSESQRNFLSQFKWWLRDVEWLRAHSDDFCNIEKFIEGNAS